MTAGQRNIYEKFVDGVENYGWHTAFEAVKRALEDWTLQQENRERPAVIRHYRETMTLLVEAQAEMEKVIEAAL